MEGNSPAPSPPPREVEIGSVNDSSNSSSSSDTSNSKNDSTSRRDSDSNASHTSKRQQQYKRQPPELQSRCTRSHLWGWTLTESCPDPLLAFARTEAKEAEETERVHELLLEERLEEERE